VYLSFLSVSLFLFPSLLPFLIFIAVFLVSGTFVPFFCLYPSYSVFASLIYVFSFLRVEYMYIHFVEGFSFLMIMKIIAESGGEGVREESERESESDKKKD